MSAPRPWGINSTADIQRFDQATLDFIRHQLSLPPSKLPDLGIPQHKYKVPEDRIVEAAVLVPLCIVDNKPSLLFEERSRNLNRHCGEVCFPGGKVDPEDTSLIAAALRETEEEVGIPASTVSVLGQLPPVPGAALTMRVHPFVALVHTSPPTRADDYGHPEEQSLELSKLRCNHSEVHRAFALPLTHFYDKSKQRLMRFRDTSLMIPAFATDKPDLEVWGLTALIIRQLLLRLDHHEPKTIKRVCRAKIEWEYQGWKARCEAQINREEGSRISPEARRRRMRMEQSGAAAGDGPWADGIPERVRTIRGREA
ncbi:hypothetical protein EV182_001541, partial [Spiromyces aspiralis]